MPVNRRQLSQAAKQAGHQLADKLWSMMASKKKRKGKTTPFGISSMQSQVLYQAAQCMIALHTYTVMTKHPTYWTCSSSPWPIKVCAGDVANAKHQLLSCALLMVDLSTFVLSCRLPSGLYQPVPCTV